MNNRKSNKNDFLILAHDSSPVVLLVLIFQGSRDTIESFESRETL